jgi:hypothetical protein
MPSEGSSCKDYPLSVAGFTLKDEAGKPERGCYELANVPISYRLIQSLTRRLPGIDPQLDVGNTPKISLRFVERSPSIETVPGELMRQKPLTNCLVALRPKLD